jgi:hypothetical protein
VIRQWVIVARQNLRLFEALAAAFCHRREFSVVLDRRHRQTARRLGKRVRSLERRRALPLDLATEQFCIVRATVGDSPELDDRFPQ